MNKDKYSKYITKTPKETDIYLKSQLKKEELEEILKNNPEYINILDEKGETILSYALNNKNQEICDLLLMNSELNIKYKDKEGNSYLHLSVKNQNENNIINILKKGINLNLQNNDGNTALHLAYELNNNSIIKLLIKNGINSRIKNKKGKIAKEIEVNKISKYSKISSTINNNNNIKNTKNKNRPSLYIFSNKDNSNYIRRKIKYINNKYNTNNNNNNIINNNDSTVLVSQSFEIKKINYYNYKINADTKNISNEESTIYNNNINDNEKEKNIKSKSSKSYANLIIDNNDKWSTIQNSYSQRNTDERLNVDNYDKKKFNTSNKKSHKQFENIFSNKIIGNKTKSIKKNFLQEKKV